VTGWGDELVTAPTAAERNDEQPPQLFYASLDEFVREQLAPMYRRALDGTQRTWCPEWWRHAEAISRLEALWRAWEHLRHDPATGISIWFRDHADHHMTILLDSDGPFKRCSADKGHSERQLDPLPVVEPPPGLFASTTISRPRSQAS
jgi:Domain of unknown function (DUF4913)